MATSIDSLDIQISASVQSANKAIDSLISNLSKLQKSLKLDTSKISNIGKNIDLSGVTNGVKSMQSQMESAGKSMENSIKKVSDMTAEFENKWKDFGKGFQFFGNEKKLEGEIVKYENALEKAKLKQEELFTAGKTDSKMYENAIKDVQKYTNILDSLRAKEVELASQNGGYIQGSGKSTTSQEQEAIIDAIIAGRSKISEFEQSVTESFERIEGQSTRSLERLKEDADAWAKSIVDLRKLSEGQEFTPALGANFQHLEEELNKVLRLIRITTGEDYTPNFSGITKEVDKVEEKLNELKEKFKDVGKGFYFEGNIEQLENEISKLQVELEKLYEKKGRQIDLGQIDTKQFETVIYDIQRITNQLSVLESTRPEALNRTLEENAQKAREASERLKEFYSNLSKLQVPKIREENLDKLNASLAKTEQRLEELRTKLENDITMGKVVESVDDSGFRKLQEQIALTEKEAEALRARIAELSPDTGSVNGFTSALAKLSSIINIVKSGFSNMSESFAKFASALKSGLMSLNKFAKSLLGLDKSSKRMNNSFSAGIKTILKYGLGIRSVYALINKLRTAVKEGFKNLAQYSNEVNESVSLLRNSLNQTKNALAAGFAPTLNALAPIINNLIQLFIRAINVFNQFTSALLGKGAWIKAKTLTDNYTKSVSGAGKAAKGALRSFDELNVITTQDSGGGGGETAAEDMFETVDVDTDISDFVEKIKQMWEDADFTELGRMVGEKIKSALEGIDWASIQATGKKIGKSIATFFNGLISPELFGMIGETIAQGMNTAIYTALAFVENFDWTNFGLSIASGINNFFETFDFKSLADTLNKWVDGIWATIKAVIKGNDGEGGINWDMIFGKLKNFVVDLDVDTTAVLAVFAAPAIIAGVTKLIGLFNTLFTIASVLSGVFSTIGAVIAAMSAPVLVAVASIAALVAGLKNAYDSNEEVRASFERAKTALAEGLQPAIEFVTQKLIPDLQAGWKRLSEILSPLGDFLSGMFVSIWQDMINPALTYVGETVLPKLTEALENLWSNVFVPLGSFLSSVFEPIISIISDLLSVLWQNIIVPLANTVGNVLASAFEGLVDIFSGVTEKVNIVIQVLQFLRHNVFSPIIDFIWGQAKPIFENAFESIGIAISEFGNILSGIIDFISGVFTGNWQKSWDSIKNILDSMLKTAVQLVINAWSSIKETFNNTIANIKNSVSTGFAFIKTTTSTALNGALTIVNNILNSIKDKFNSIMDSAKQIVQSGIERIKSFFNFSWSLPSLKLPHFKITGSFSLNPPSVPSFGIDWYASGGYLPSQFSLIGAGEGGVPEILGTVGGKPAVAGGAEITGISDAVYSTGRTEAELLQTAVRLLQIIAEKDYGITEQQIGKAAQKFSREYMASKGRPAFDF